MPEATTTEDILSGVIKGMGSSASPIEAGKSAPGIIGQPVFEHRLKLAEMAGAKSFGAMFGHKKSDNDKSSALPLNYGSRKSTGFMTDADRMGLLHLKKLISDAEIQACFKYKGQHITTQMIMDTDNFKFMLAPMLKAYNITDFSSFLETVNARFYFEEYDIPFLLEDQFDQLPMDAATVHVPGDIGHLEGVEETDTATFAPQSTVQDGYDVHSRNNVVHAQITQDLLSDSAPAYIEKLRRDVMMGRKRSKERAIINGDTAGSPRGASHMDTDIAALALNATFSKAFDGIRKRAFGNSANGSIVDHAGDTPSKLMFANALKAMGKFGSEKDDLIFLVSSSVENALVTGAIPELFTAFAFGGLASNVTGQCPPVFGIKVITSQYQREDLAVTGKYTGAGQSHTSIQLIKKSRFASYTRQATRIWAAPSLPSSDVMLMTSKTRESWAGNNQSATEKSVINVIGIATAP